MASNPVTRTNTVSTAGYDSDNESPGDPTSTLGLLEERLQAWKHMCGYLEDYIKAVMKDQKTQAKDSDKILKTLNSPLKEGHHFAQELGGIAGLFENLRVNTQAQSTLYLETEQNLEKSVLPIFERLHKEIKAKRKELDSGAGKQNKAVESSRNSAQKHIELLGQHTATFDSAGGKTTANNDPYVLQRGVWYRLNKQLAEENNHRSDLINVQNNFQQFEVHVVTTVQSGLAAFNQYMGSQHDRIRAIYGDVTTTANNIDPNFEWNGFNKRNGHILVSPNAPGRTIDSMTFPNLNHRSTKALIEGSLERKSRGMGALGSYKSNYYAVTPAGYMHEYKDNDNFRGDPEPEHSLFLPDCVVGAADGQKFTIKGKDSSGNKFSQKLSMTSEYQFKAHTASDAQQWRDIIASLATGSSSLPTSPISPQTTHEYPPPQNLNAVAGQQTTGTTGAPVQQQHFATGAGGAPVQQQHFATGAGGAPVQQQPLNTNVAGGHTMAPGQASTVSPVAAHGQETGTLPVRSAEPVSSQSMGGHGGLQAQQQPQSLARAPSGAYHVKPVQNELEPRKY